MIAPTVKKSGAGGEIPDVDLTQVPPVSKWIHSPLLIRAAPHVPHKVDGIKCTATSQVRQRARRVWEMDSRKYALTPTSLLAASSQ